MQIQSDTATYYFTTFCEACVNVLYEQINIGLIFRQHNNKLESYSYPLFSINLFLR
jgi:hypothetical protein